MVKNVLPLLVLLFCFTACSNNQEARVAVDKEMDLVYHDYQVSAEEGREDVTVRLQFLTGSAEGEAITLEAPSGVLLDNEPLPADSTRFMGTYYEVSKPMASFAGSHTIVYIDKEKKQYRETFRFLPFALAEELPEELAKKPFTIRLRNLPDEPVTLRLVMTDTSMTSAGVNEELTVEDGRLEVTADMLAELAPGPVTLEIYSEEERPLNGNDGSRGRMAITYSLRRQLLLR